MNVKKVAATTAALSLTAAVAVGGTLAWLTANSDTVTNTFTIGEVGIQLFEKDYTTGGDAWLDASKGPQSQEFTLIPGQNVNKEVKAKVTEGSEKSIAYLKVSESENFDTYFPQMTLENGWTALGAGYEDYYYQVVDTNKIGKDLEILKTLTPDANELTNENANDIKTNLNLSFQVAAVQYDNLTGSDDAAKAVDGFSKLPEKFTGAKG